MSIAHVDPGYRDFVPGAAIAAYLRVKITGGKVALAGVGSSDADNEIGVTTGRSTAADDVNMKAIATRNKQGTVTCTADGAVAAFALVYGAASGKVGTTSSGAVFGMAMEAAGADGDYIEVLRY